MSLLSASNLAKSYGPDDIFRGVSLSIPYQARIAIVGPNGIGKTTLLRLLMGIEEPTKGQIRKARNISIGYLPQEASLQGDHSLWQECLGAVAELRTKEAQLADMEAAMSDPQQAAEILERYGKLQQEFELLGGYTYETRIRQTLTGLGFEQNDYDRPITQLSGGQRTRALLARLLLSKPDLLVLDEPTNHLDIKAVEWLEGYLSQWQGAALIVSHDRYFLDRVVDHIWEMIPSGLEVYRGNYSAYLIHRQERWDLSQQIFQAEKARLEKELDYIKRNIAGQNTTQAKGKLRRLSREVQAIEALGFQILQTKSWSEISRQIVISPHPMGVAELESRIHSLRGPNRRPPRLSINLKATHRSGDLVLRTRDLAIGYADEGRPLFRSPDLLLKRRECAAFIGPNGAGKTTFLKTLLEQVPPLEGQVILGASLQIGYFAQAHEDLQPGHTLIEEIESVAPNMLMADIRSYLARFLFSGEEVFKKVLTLSGGERGRLALAKLSLTSANLLLLDEPTNHLDIPSQEILQEVLSNYQGTILLVSHDRYLIDALGSQIWDILPDQEYLQVFEGTYTQYRAYLDAQIEQDLGAAQTSHKPSEATRRSHTSNQQRRRKARLAQVEEQISTLEEQLSTLAQKLENPPDDPRQVQKLGKDYVSVQNELDALLAEWEELHE
ncbi:ribosomal protection-like ABC-F family protein [Chloroflexota bacterium]